MFGVQRSLVGQVLALVVYNVLCSHQTYNSLPQALLLPSQMLSWSCPSGFLSPLIFNPIVLTNWLLVIFCCIAQLSRKTQ